MTSGFAVVVAGLCEREIAIRAPLGRGPAANLRRLVGQPGL